MRRAVGVAVAALTLCSCARRETAGPLRLGLLPAENLSGDESLDWIGASVPVLLAAQLEGAPGVTVVRHGSRRDAVTAGASSVLCRYDAHNGRLTLDCFREGTEQPIRSDGALEGGLSAIVTPVGQGLHPDARPAPVVSDSALRAYAARDFLEAVRLAPDFGYAYADGASMALLTGDRTTADRLIADGMARATGIGDIPRARLYLLSGTLSQNRGDQIAALRQLTAIIPGEPDYWQRLAQALGAQNEQAEAAEAQEKLASLQPDNPAVWNQLAYYRSWSGNLAAAKTAAARYEALAPGSANASDTLGEVCFYAGEFADAEKHFLESMSRDSNFLGGSGYFKAAMARLRMGDAAKAEEHYRQFAERSGAAKDFLLAQWLYITGGDAIAAMERAGGAPEVAAVAQAQLAVWLRLDGQPAPAQAAAAKALIMARNPLARRTAQTAMFVAMPAADMAAWQDRVRTLAPGAELEEARRMLVAQALIAQGDFAAARPLVRKAFQNSVPPQDRESRILLAWCLKETGDSERASELLKVNPVPAAPLTGPFDSVLLRKELELRKAAN